MQTSAALSASVVLALLLFSAQPLHAQADACGMLKPAELTALLGPSPTPTPHPNSCLWKGADGTHKLSLAKMKATGARAEMAFMGAHQNAGGSGTVSDEAGLGAKAFATLTSIGVALTVLKQGRLMQMQYYTGGQGTPKDLDTLRPVAKKAVAAF
jgi:hypothetical protein